MGNPTNIGLEVIGLILSYVMLMLFGALMLEILQMVRINQFSLKGIFNKFKENWGRLFSINLVLILVGAAIMFLTLIIGGILTPTSDPQKIDVLAIIIGLIGGLLIIVLFAYLYAFAFFYIEDEPHNGPITNLKKSRQDLKNHRMELFKVDMKYIPILALFFILNMIGVLTESETLSIISKILGLLASFWAVPQMTIARSLFYDRLVNGRVIDER